MSFAEPIWLYLLPALLLLLALLFVWSERRAHRRLAAFASSKLLAALTASYSRPRHLLKLGLVGLAVSLLLAALARPQYGFVLEESESRGLDIMIALDTSRSMLAEDVVPTRLERAKLAILDVLEDIRGDRVGLIAFAGDAFLQAPLTLDHGAFRQTLAITDTRTIPRGGTDIAAAINEARSALDRRGNEKLLILISDGEDLDAAGIRAAREAATDGIRIFTVGVGTPEGAPIMVDTRNPLIPSQDNWERDFVRGPDGQPVRSALDERTLREIAAVTEGIYVPLGSGGSGLRAIIDEVRALFPEMEHGSRLQEVPLERYQWPLAAGLLLLLLEPMLSTRRRNPPLARGVTLSAALVFFSLLLASPLEASPQRALEAYQQGNYARAVELYEAAIEANPDDARLQYNYGNALYRMEDWRAAADAFRLALRTTDPALQSHAFFNRGNALFQLGRSLPDDAEARQSTKEYWEEALAQFANARALQPDAQDVSQNESLVRRELLRITARLGFAVNPPGAGTVLPEEGTFVRGATLPIEARAQNGWLFRGWEGGEIAEPSEARTELILREDTIVIAHFVKTWQLEVVSADPDAGTASESGVYPEDEPVSIQAEANDHYAFLAWEATENATIADANAAQTQVQLTGDATVTATFQDAFLLSVNIEPTIGGTAGDSGWYPINSEVPVQAEPREGFSWSGWLGEGIREPLQPQTAVTLDRNRRVTAAFNREWNLIVYPDPLEGGNAIGSSPEPIGTTVPLSAEPNEGFVFERWEGPGVADPLAAETTATIESATHDIAAVFRQEDNDEDQDQDQDQDQDENSSESDESDPSEEPEEPEQPDEPEESDESDEPEEPEPSEEPEEAPPAPAEREPGTMTEEEARQLLNLLRETEQKLPATRRPEDAVPTDRDW